MHLRPGNEFKDKKKKKKGAIVTQIGNHQHVSLALGLIFPRSFKSLADTETDKLKHVRYRTTALVTRAAQADTVEDFDSSP